MIEVDKFLQNQLSNGLRSYYRLCSTKIRSRYSNLHIKRYKTLTDAKGFNLQKWFKRMKSSIYLRIQMAFFHSTQR